jgi:hypothetical protein
MKIVSQQRQPDGGRGSAHLRASIRFGLNGKNVMRRFQPAKTPVATA